MKFPLTKITIGFTLGILFCYYLNPEPKTVFTVLSITAVALIVVGFISSEKIVFGILAALLSFVVGIATWSIHQETFRKNHYIHLCKTGNENHTVIISLTEKLKSSSYKNRYIATVNYMDGKAVMGRIILNVEKKNNNIDFIVGSRLMLNGTVLRHKTPANPNQFDYGKYLNNKYIPAQLYAPVSAIRVNREHARSIWFYAANIRERVLRNLRKNHFRDEELNVVLALILGQQQEISSEILHDYQFAGAVHVLSVSGLHIGFILLFLNFILSGLPKNNTGRISRFLIILISLWGFAIIAGLSPSVVRSVTMFSFVAAGMSLKRETNIFHTLMVSVLLILLFSPSFLFDVGFQLSYVSLFFILWLQPMFSALWQPGNKIGKYFWDILTVSFAAQIGAFPLSIYYFHQFPGLFFITNLVILPCLGVIMALGVVVVIMAAFNYVPRLPSYLLEWCIHILNSIINRIASFSQFVIQDIPLNESLLICIYLVIIGTVIWFKRKTFRNLIIGLLALLAFQIALFVTKWNNQHHNEMIVFHIIKSTIISEKTGDEVTVFSSNTILKQIPENKMLKSYLTANFCSIAEKRKIENMAYFGNKKILIIDSNAIAPKRYHPDLVLMTQSPKINLSRLLDNIHPEIIIADGSNYTSYIKLWRATCKKRKIPFHATAEKGFYRLE